MSEGPSRAVYSTKDVIGMVTLEDCDDDDEDDVDEVFFPASDDEQLGFETEIDNEQPDLDDQQAGERLDCYNILSVG